MSWLFQTCIRLQTSLDSRFLKLGVTMQEASVLLRCVEARRVTAGQLAIALGRDKSKVTRFIDRLEASHLLTRDIDPRDRRFSVLKPTAKAKRIARDVASVFDNIRKELFVGILESDVRRLGRMLPQLHKNAVRIGTQSKRKVVRARRRIGKPENQILVQVREVEVVGSCQVRRRTSYPLPGASFQSTHDASILDECSQIIEFGKDGSYSKG